ncbi:MAG: arginase family protein, partial [Candidatus Nanohalobium sp.]
SVGGDHSISFPVLKALKQRFPDLKLVWLDAHLDLKRPVDGHVSHDVVVRELLNYGFSEDDIVFIGITEVDHDEKDFLKDHEFRIYRSGDVLLSEALEKERFEDPTYLSVDIDALTAEEAPGTGYRDGSLSSEQVLEVIESVNPDHGDIVEVAPSLDRNRRTVGNARKILKKLLESVKK